MYNFLIPIGSVAMSPLSFLIGYLCFPFFLISFILFTKNLFLFCWLGYTDFKIGHNYPLTSKSIYSVCSVNLQLLSPLESELALTCFPTQCSGKNGMCSKSWSLSRMYIYSLRALLFPCTQAQTNLLENEKQVIQPPAMSQPKARQLIKPELLSPPTADCRCRPEKLFCWTQPKWPACRTEEGTK